MIRALLLAGVFGFLLGVAATFGFFQLSAPERAFPSIDTVGEEPQAEGPGPPDQEIAAPSPASGSAVPSPSQAPAGPPATREELDEDD